MSSVLPFIEVDGRGRLSVGSAAADFLSGMPGPLAVVALAGRYRTGKSFLAKQLVGADGGGSGGFSVGHTVASHTKGIWLCGRAVAGGADGELPVLFLDSEGLGATDKVGEGGSSRE